MPTPRSKKPTAALKKSPKKSKAKTRNPSAPTPPAALTPVSTSATISIAPANGKYLTLADIAKVVNVHPTTVSLALRDHPSIPPSTRAKIREAAQLLGYRRDPMLDAFNFHRLRNHTKKRTLAMAFVVDARTADIFHGTPYHPLVYQGAREAAEARNYTLEPFPVGPKHLAAERLQGILSARGITGLLVSTFSPETPTLNLDWSHFCAVKIESQHLKPALDVVSNDQWSATRLCLRELRALGYRRIGLATALEDEIRLGEPFRTGLLVEQDEIPAKERTAPLLFTHADIPQLGAKLANWIKRERLDAFMSNWNDLPTHLATQGISTPRDIAFASLDIPMNRPELTGIVQNHQLVGRKAMEQLSILVETYHRGPPALPSITFVGGYWRPGKSAPEKK